MTADTLRFAGQALYGSRWQSDVARLVGRPQSHVAEWAAGKRPIPADVWPALLAAVEARETTCRALAKKLRRGIDAARSMV